jgi:hypothetical protein
MSHCLYNANIFVLNKKILSSPQYYNFIYYKLNDIPILYVDLNSRSITINNSNQIISVMNSNKSSKSMPSLSAQLLYFNSTQMYFIN